MASTGDGDRRTPGALLRLLVVDDDAAVRELARLAADDHPQLVLSGMAADGPEAVSAATDLNPDVILLDYQMPSATGIEILPHLLAAAPSATVVMFSASDEIQTENGALNAGAAAYFVKGLHDIESALDAAAAIHAGRHATGIWAWCGDACKRWYYSTEASSYCPVCASVPTAFSVDQPSDAP